MGLGKGFAHQINNIKLGQFVFFTKIFAAFYHLQTSTIAKQSKIVAFRQNKLAFKLVDAAIGC